jgi:hypothetical protein
VCEEEGGRGEKNFLYILIKKMTYYCKKNHGDKKSTGGFKHLVDFGDP